MPGARTTALLGVSLLVAALGFASTSLLVPGIAFTALALIAIAWVELAARSLRLERASGPARLTEGATYPLRIEAHGGLLPAPAGELRDPLLDRPVPIGPRWSRRLVIDVAVGGRGRRALGASRLELRDPLGLRSRTIEGDDAGELLVLPRVEPIFAPGRGSRGARLGRRLGLEDAAAASGLEARAVEMEVDGLRPYRPGSPASRIHWPAVARSRELIERRLVAGADSGPLVVLDATRPFDAEALDAAVRAAASLCFHLAAAGGCAVLLPGERRVVELEPDARAWAHVHARLAAVEAGVPAPQPAGLARTGTVFWVTADGRPALPSSLRAGAFGRRYLVAPSRLLAGRPAFTVAGCCGRLIGGRMRGPRALRSAA